MKQVEEEEEGGGGGAREKVAAEDEEEEYRILRCPEPLIFKVFKVFKDWRHSFLLELQF